MTECLELAPAICRANHTVFRNLSEMGMSGVSSSHMPPESHGFSAIYLRWREVKSFTFHLGCVG